ncbi:MAG TPA: PP2C family protein-serine/threonine phosphatase [Anaeromyxobacteraceae bacterium]|nr:PP2C family protein-serine/threonine phosphatase [Anaeromyxobacteraceae bacterium]
MPTGTASELARRRTEGAATAFQRYLDGLVHSWLGTVSALAFTLVPLFLALDVFTAPRPLLLRFALYRGVATGACLAIFAILRRTQPSRWSFVYGYVIAVVVGGSITAMTVDLGGFDSRYFAGLNLVIAGVNLFLPWRPAHSTLNGLLVVAMYVVANAALGGPFDPRLLASNLFFMLSTVVIAVAMTYARLELVQKEFELRSELLDANALLEESRQELRSARDALWGEMEVAKRIQTALLPPDQRAGPWDVAAAMRPAAEVGGDYYDIVSPPGGRRWIAVGDVSGHGVESGLVMMMTQTAILSLVRQDPALGPAGVLRAVNGVICENLARLGGDRYMTLNVVRLDEGGLTLAGKHQDLLVWRQGERRVEVVANDGTWIGLVPELGDSSPESFVPLAPGDAVLFYTDGVTEALDASGRMYGEERLAAAFAGVAGRPLPQAIDAILDEVARFASDQADDRTLLIVRRCEA